MNITQYAIDLVAQVLHISPSSIPSALWDYYVQYLCYYNPDSVVARIAYTFRILALLLIMPAVILILLVGPIFFKASDATYPFLERTYRHTYLREL